MELKDLMTISGQSGLFKYVSQGRNGIIVEGLEDQKRLFVPTSARVSSMADIAIYSAHGEVPLKEMLNKMREKSNGEQIISHKSEEKELKQYFESILPDYDHERVYMSDIRKVFNWYNILQKQNQLSILDIEDKPEEVESKSDPLESDQRETEEKKGELKTLKSETKHIDKPLVKSQNNKPKTNSKPASFAPRKVGSVRKSS